MKFIITIALFSLMVLVKSTPTDMEDDVDRTRQILSETAARQAELWKNIEVHPRIAEEALMTAVCNNLFFINKYNIKIINLLYSLNSLLAVDIQ